MTIRTARTANAHRLRNFGPTVFAEYTRLANEHGAINLGQGFPDFAAPDFIKAAAQQAIAADLNQYADLGDTPDPLVVDAADGSDESATDAASAVKTGV